MGSWDPGLSSGPSSWLTAPQISALGPSTGITLTSPTVRCATATAPAVSASTNGCAAAASWSGGPFAAAAVTEARAETATKTERAAGVLLRYYTAGGQKNIGVAGATIVILNRDSVIGETPEFKVFLWGMWG